MKLIGIVLVALGVLALAYGGFSYTRTNRKAKLGPFEFSMKDKERVDVPTWAGAAAVVVGTGLLLAAGKRR